MAGTKVGEGYIEITPRVQGLTNELRQKAQNSLNDWKDAKFTVSPKISGITKAWQSEVQKELNDKITGLTVKVAVKVDKTGIKASFDGVTVEAKQTGDKAGKDLSDGFKTSTDFIKRYMRETEVAIKAGILPASDGSVKQRLDTISDTYRGFASNLKGFSASQVNTIRSGVNEMNSLQNAVTRTVDKEANAAKRAGDILERQIRKTILDTDAMVNQTQANIRKHQDLNRSVIGEIGKAVTLTGSQMGNLLKAFPELLSQAAPAATKAAASFGGTIGDAISTTSRFAIARMVTGLPLMFAGLAYAVGPVSAGIQSLAAGVTLLAGQAIYAAGAILALPAAFAAVAQGASVLGIAFYGIEEALGALKAEQLQSSRATDQMADQMALANRRVADAKRSLVEAQTNSAERITQSEENLARTSESAAERISAAQEQLAETTADVSKQIEASQSRLVEAQENAASKVEQAQSRLADAQADMASQIADAQARLSDVIASTSERIAESEQALSRAREDAADRISEAQDRVTRSYEDGARRVTSAEADNARALRDVTEAQLALTQAREDAKERLEDLANTIISGKLGEEAAQFALDDARDALAAIQLTDASDRDKAKADLNYREALQRLREIQERNEDLRQEQEQADKDGIEGSKEVERAKDGINDAIERQIESEQSLTDARREAAEAAMDAEKNLADAREDAARSVGDAEKNLTDARKQATKDIASAEQELADVRIDASKRVTEAEQAVITAGLEGAKAIADAEAALLVSRTEGAKRIADSEKDLAEVRKQAIRDVSDAEKDLTKTRVDGSKSVEDSQRSLREAMEDIVRASDNQTSAASKTEEILKKLSPAGREFVLFLQNELMPRFQEVQESIQQAFLPPLQEALEKSGGVIDIFQVKLTDTATIFGGFVTKFGEWLNTDETKNSIGKIMDSNNRIFEKLGPAAISGIDGIKTLVEESGPFLEGMATKVGTIATKFKTWMDQAKEDGTLKEFFRRTEKAIGDILEIIGHVGIAFGGILEASWEPGQKLMDTIKKAAKEFADWVTSIEGQNQLKAWFEKGRAVMDELFLLVEKIIKEFLKLGTDVDFAAFLKVLRTDLVPAFSRLLEVFTTDGGSGLIAAIEAMAVAVDTLRVALGILSFALPPSPLLKGFQDGLLNSINPMKDLGGSSEATGKQITDSAKTLEFLAKKLSTDMPGAIAVYKDILANEGAAAAAKWKETYEKISGHSLDIKAETGKNATGMVTEQKLSQGQLQKNSEDTWAAIHKIVVDKSSGLKVEGSKYISDFGSNTKNTWTDINKDTTIQSAAMVTTVKEKTGSLRPVGENAVQGFWDGIQSRWTDLINWWNANLGGLAELAKRILEVNSPSLVMARIGDSVGEGLALGIKRSMSHVTDATGAMASSVVGAWGGKLTLPVEANIPNYRPPAQTANGQMKFNTQPVTGGSGKNYYVTLNATPTVPTERQLLTILSYADTLYK